MPGLHRPWRATLAGSTLTGHAAAAHPPPRAGLAHGRGHPPPSCLMLLVPASPAPRDPSRWMPARTRRSGSSRHPGGLDHRWARGSTPGARRRATSCSSRSSRRPCPRTRPVDLAAAAAGPGQRPRSRWARADTDALEFTLYQVDVDGPVGTVGVDLATRGGRTAPPTWSCSRRCQPEFDGAPRGRLPARGGRAHSRSRRSPRPTRPRCPTTSRRSRSRVAIADVTLAGTLTVPRTHGPHPAIVLVQRQRRRRTGTSRCGRSPPSSRFALLADALRVPASPSCATTTGASARPRATTRQPACPTSPPTSRGPRLPARSPGGRRRADRRAGPQRGRRLHRVAHRGR